MKMKIGSWGTPLLVLLLALILAAPAGARPKQGDMTVNLGMTELAFSSGTQQACDEDGEDCEDVADVSSMKIGLGGSVGFLISDLFEAGGSLYLDVSSSTTEYEYYDSELESSTTALGGSAYAKVHLGNSPTLVPFIAGGLGLGIASATLEETDKGDEVEAAGAELRVFLEGGAAYYVGEKYGITASVSLIRLGRGFDEDTDDDENGVESFGETTVRFGFGLTTYF